MAKGQKQAAERELALQNRIGGEALGRARGFEEKVAPAYESMIGNLPKVTSGYTSMLESPGYTPTEKEAQRTTAFEGLTSPFEAAGAEAGRRAGRTGQLGGLAAEESELALKKGEAGGRLAAGLEQTFGERERMDRMYGLSGLEKLTGMGTAGLAGLGGQEEAAAMHMYGLGPGTLQARAAGGSPFMDLLKAGIGAGGAMGAAALGPHP